MVLAEIKDWLGVLSAAGVIASFVMMNWLRAQFVTTDQAREHGRKIEALEDRISRIEGEVGHLPDQGSMHRMELALTAMKGDLNVMTERMKAVAATGERLQEYLVDQAGRK